MVDVDEPDWFLQAWMIELGRKQADLVSDLGWHKTAAHRIWHSRQPYRRDHVNQVAAWLGIRPFELLMSPAEAMAMRRLRDSARLIAAEETGRSFDHQLDQGGAARQTK